MKGEPTATAPPARSRAEVEKMIRENQRLVWWCVNRFLPRLSEEDREDAYSAGLVGLWYAVERYNPLRGRFSTFAIPAIRGRLCSWNVTRNRMKRKIDRDAISLSTPLHAGEDGATLEDTIPDDRVNFTERTIARDEADRALAHCSERERRIMEALGQGLTLDAVGGLEGGVSRERVRQIKVMAMKKIERAVKR